MSRALLKINPLNNSKIMHDFFCDVPVLMVGTLRRTRRTHKHLDAAMNIKREQKGTTDIAHINVDKLAELVDELGTINGKYIELDNTHLASLEMKRRLNDNTSG